VRRERFSHRQPDLASVTWLLSFIIVTNSDLALVAETVGPETFERWGSAGHAVVSNEKPGTEDRFGQNIEDSISENLSID